MGLNMTGANVVIIYDPNWNPTHDLQAQDRWVVNNTEEIYADFKDRQHFLRVVRNSCDSQAISHLIIYFICRVYRLGQSRDVRVYRLITMGTVEENIYLRQVYKQVEHKHSFSFLLFVCVCFAIV